MDTHTSFAATYAETDDKMIFHLKYANELLVPYM